MKYVKTNESSFGWHIEFDALVTANNFKQACQLAIDFAKSDDAMKSEKAINFVAQGISIQVVGCDDVEIQFALWQRRFTAALESPLLPGHIRMVKLQEEGRLQKGDLSKP